MRSISGNEVIKKLAGVGFAPARQRGSHVKLKRTAAQETKIVIVPLHKDLPEGTLHSIARQAGLTYKEFQTLF